MPHQLRHGQVVHLRFEFSLGETVPNGIRERRALTRPLEPLEPAVDRVARPRVAVLVLEHPTVAGRDPPLDDRGGGDGEPDEPPLLLALGLRRGQREQPALRRVVPGVRVAALRAGGSRSPTGTPGSPGTDRPRGSASRARRRLPGSCTARGGWGRASSSRPRGSRSISPCRVAQANARWTHEIAPRLWFAPQVGCASDHAVKWCGLSDGAGRAAGLRDNFRWLQNDCACQSVHLKVRALLSALTHSTYWSSTEATDKPSGDSGVVPAMIAWKDSHASLWVAAVLGPVVRRRWPAGNWTYQPLRADR